MTTEDLQAKVIEAIRTVKDPELPVNLYDLGLIYDLAIEAGHLAITMTLTTPNCPVAEQLPIQVRDAALGVDGIDTAEVELVWEPAWTGERMSEQARMALDMMGISWSDPHSGPKTTPLTRDRKNT
ncbi:MAG: iron-sulfur cluster assembly protein [Planctomycetota bacterium]|jgi:FeS assembly SUF system protein